MMRRRYRVRPRLVLSFVVLVVLAVLVPRILAHHAPGGSPSRPTHPATRPASQPSSAPPVVATGSWHRAAWTLSAPARGQAATVGDGDLILAGGLDSASSSTVQAYGPNRIAVSLPTAVHDAGAVVTGGDLIVFGGGTVAPTATVQAVPLAGGSVLTPAALPQPLADLTAVTVAGRVYLVGGYSGTVYSDKVFQWSAGQALSVAAVLPVGLRYAAITVDGSQIVVAGGRTPTGESAAVYAVNPVTGHVSTWPSLPTPLAYAGAAVLSGRLWVVGGQTPSGNSAATYVYDASTRTWKSGPSLPLATTDGTLTAFHGKLWYAGGQTAQGITATVWEFP